MTQPASVSTNGTVRAAFLPAVADLDDVTLVEINAVTSLDFSCYATGEGLNVETSQNNIEDARLCSKATYESPGDYTDTLEITYVFNPASAGDNEAQLELTEGRKGFVVLRWGVDAETAWTVADIVDVYPVTLGVQRKNNPTRNGVHKITQKCFVTGAVHRESVVSAS